MFVAAATIEDDVNAAGMVDRGRMARRKAGLRKRKAIFSVGRAKEPRQFRFGTQKVTRKGTEISFGKPVATSEFTVLVFCVLETPRRVRQRSFKVTMLKSSRNAIRQASNIERELSWYGASPVSPLEHYHVKSELLDSWYLYECNCTNGDRKISAVVYTCEVCVKSRLYST
jgi:hypothetical protein